MHLDGLLTDLEIPCDLLVQQAPCHARKDLALTQRQLRNLVGSFCLSLDERIPGVRPQIDLRTEKPSGLAVLTEQGRNHDSVAECRSVTAIVQQLCQHGPGV